MSNFICTAGDVLSKEIEGLTLLKDGLRTDTSLEKAFTATVESCLAVQGRLIVSGMGKSGHIARKIAATFASTGTPASYVHPGEASHGDLGMISQHDIVIALSNSGETPELKDLLTYTHRFGIVLIAITSNPDSTLARAGTIGLILPKATEACRITKAPTTSTTMMLALGDAIAVALLHAKGFSADDFHNFHPGGKLGAGFKRVTDLMHDRAHLPLCLEGTAVLEAATIIDEAGLGCVGVLDAAGHLIGIITDGDLRRHLTKDFTQMAVSDVMTKNPVTLTSDSLAAEALGVLSEKKVTAVFIVNKDNAPVGLLHVHDCLDNGVI